jgi:tRNA uridine 5-carboxymethylaminomethyl modification enzyme
MHTVVIGAGHAGVEAALAAARVQPQARVTLFTLSLASIASMPCNPCIGGSAKGHLVREVDALGGEMGRAIDHAYIQSRMLGTAKGPAVYSLRAQADKEKYHVYMKNALESTPNVTLREGEIIDILTDGDKITAVVAGDNETIPCTSAVVAAGTYLKSRCLIGTAARETGPGGLQRANHLSNALRKLGFPLMRFKTGTPARVHKHSVDFTQMQVQHGDDTLVPFSFETDPADILREQVPCYLTYTNENTHEIIRQNIDKSAMYNGMITATGTRYCPSIEDKIVRFSDKERHPVFVEPDTPTEMYIQGMSSALPQDVQLAMYRTIPGLENCEFTKPAYAIEYDVIDATQLDLSLQAKQLRGLFFAGQICGSSGYEEAAAQGIIAGLAAAGAPVILGRDDGYIGVLIDDLVTKGTAEPYRMMTSRAEYRLLLRQDNADLRLTPIGRKAGLISDSRWQLFSAKAAAIAAELAYVHRTIIPPQAANALLHEKNSAPVQSGVCLAELIRRPELDYDSVAPLSHTHNFADLPPFIAAAARQQVNIQIKYDGYIAMQLRQVEGFRKMEDTILPATMDYAAITGMRLEARQKLAAIRPASLGQASRIIGISPADLQVLLLSLR